MGTGITLAALSNHHILSVNTLSNAGKYVLGIYVVHYMFVDILSPVSESISNPALGNFKSSRGFNTIRRHSHAFIKK